MKVVCYPYDGAAEKKHGRKKATDARFEILIGSSWEDSLFTWFPAAWMPLVVGGSFVTECFSFLPVQQTLTGFEPKS